MIHSDWHQLFIAHYCTSLEASLPFHRTPQRFHLILRLESSLSACLLPPWGPAQSKLHLHTPETPQDERTLCLLISCAFGGFQKYRTRISNKQTQQCNSISPCCGKWMCARQENTKRTTMLSAIPVQIFHHEAHFCHTPFTRCAWPIEKPLVVSLNQTSHCHLLWFMIEVSDDFWRWHCTSLCIQTIFWTPHRFPLSCELVQGLHPFSDVGDVTWALECDVCSEWMISNRTVTSMTTMCTYLVADTCTWRVVGNLFAL